jgi:glycosyl transferase family 2
MTAPSFSIVIPAYNARRTLADTLASVAAQSDGDYEVIVVDDGSTDGTADLATERLDARGRVHRQENRGLPGARNAGIRHSAGRWVAFLDADDLWMPTYLARMRKLLEAGGDALGVAYCDAWIYDDRRRRVARRSAFERYRPAEVPVDPRAFYLELLEENFIWVAACVPRSVLDEVGGFDERLRASEDWNMWLRIVATGRRAAGTTDRLGLYRHSEGQMHADLGRMLEGQRDCMRGVLESAPLDGELRAATEARLARCERVLAEGPPIPGWRRVVSRALGPVRPVKDFRLRAPPDVAAAYGHLFDRPEPTSASQSGRKNAR